MSRSRSGGSPRLLIPLLICCALAAAPALAGVDAAAVRQAVEHFLAGHRDDFLARNPGITRADFTVAALDPRLTLPDCATPLAVEAQQTRQLQARINTQVSCTSGNGWSLYVPIDVAIYRPVVIAARPLDRGDVLTEADLISSELDVTRLHGAYLTEIPAAVGLEVRRPLAAQAIVSQQMLQPPLLIRRGESVSIRAAGQAIAVHMNGVALSDGRLGQPIRVRNSSSNRVVEAKVVGPGVTEVAL